jgi:hypothetical protein
VIVRGNRQLAQAYALHINGVYDHYSWRAFLASGGDPDQIFKPLDGWKPGGSRVQELAFWMNGPIPPQAAAAGQTSTPPARPRRAVTPTPGKAPRKSRASRPAKKKKTSGSARKTTARKTKSTGRAKASGKARKAKASGRASKTKTKARRR